MRQFKKIWVHKASSFESAEKFDRNYYALMSGQERVSAIQMLREIYNKIRGAAQHEDRKRLRRVIKIIK